MRSPRNPVRFKTTPRRSYRIRFIDGTVAVVNAETVCEPDASVEAVEIRFYVFKLGGVVVAKYREADVSGWQLA